MFQRGIRLVVYHVQCPLCKYTLNTVVTACRRLHRRQLFPSSWHLNTRRQLTEVKLVQEPVKTHLQK